LERARNGVQEELYLFFDDKLFPLSANESRKEPDTLLKLARHIHRNSLVLTESNSVLEFKLVRAAD